MAMHYERLSRHAQEAAAAFRQNRQPDIADSLDAQALGYQAQAKIIRALGIPEEFPSAKVEQVTAVREATVPANLTQASETRLPAQASRLTIATFRDQLIEGLKSHGQEIALPETYISPEIVEVYNILAGEGYDVAPIAHVDGKRKEVRIGVFETVARPDYTDGTQMYYNPRKDPLTDILVRGREGNKIAVPNFVKHVPFNSRFAVSWGEIKKYVAPEARKTTPHLAEQLAKGGITFDIPDLADFRSAGQTHEQKLVANSWEWVQDSAWFGPHLIAGSRGGGGLKAVGGWPSGDHDDGIAFRLQAVSRPQQLP